MQFPQHPAEAHDPARAPDPFGRPEALPEVGQFHLRPEGQQILEEPLRLLIFYRRETAAAVGPSGGASSV